MHFSRDGKRLSYAHAKEQWCWKRGQPYRVDLGTNPGPHVWTSVLKFSCKKPRPSFSFENRSIKHT